jgi:multiple sugar transport system ATP-binding protein
LTRPGDIVEVRAALDARTPDDAILLAEQRATFTIRLPGDAPVTLGEPLKVSVDPSRLYLFDPNSGAALA